MIPTQLTATEWVYKKVQPPKLPDITIGCPGVFGLSALTKVSAQTTGSPAVPSQQLHLSQCHLDRIAVSAGVDAVSSRSRAFVFRICLVRSRTSWPMAHHHLACPASISLSPRQFHLPFRIFPKNSRRVSALHRVALYGLSASLLTPGCRKSRFLPCDRRSSTTALALEALSFGWADHSLESTTSTNQIMTL